VTGLVAAPLLIEFSTSWSSARAEAAWPFFRRDLCLSNRIGRARHSRAYQQPGRAGAGVLSDVWNRAR